jgi:F5/8 type C domain/Secretion system C-terminal sorting domain
MKIFLRHALMVLEIFALASRLSAQTDMLTQHNDFSRTGWNQTESILKVSNVNPNNFGLLTSRSVDDQIYAQPLVVSGVDIKNSGVLTNIVYVATVNNTLYAFNADDGTIPVYWTLHMTTPGFRPPQNTDMHPGYGAYNDFYDNNSPFVGFFGIVGTPVIDKSTNTLYVVTRDVNTAIYDAGPYSDVTKYNSTGFYQYLHAIDIRTGTEKPNSPVLITASAPGTSPANQGGIVHFDPRRQNQRGGLLLLNGVVYIPYAAHGDWSYYSGWILGYDASNLQQKISYLVSPNDGGGGIWMSGGGLAADPAANGGKGSIYYASGNSNNGDPSMADNRGESIVRLDPNGIGSAVTKLNLGDYFTPFDYQSLNSADLDFGTQVMLVPNSNLLVAGCKDHNLYVFDKTNLGGFHKNRNTILQKFPVANNAQMHASFAYFGGSTHKYFYQFSENTNLKAYAVSANSLGGAISGVSNGPSGASGSYMSTSSNGTDETTGILWIAHPEPGCNANQKPCDGILRAVEAINVNNEIWNSDMNTIDNVGKHAKNVCPTIANGKVYLATQSNKMNVYGILASNPRCATNVALNKTASASSNSNVANKAFDGNFNTEWSGPAKNDYLEVDLGASYDICRFSITWESNPAGTGTDYNIEVADNATGPWKVVESMTNNFEFYNEFNGSYTGRYVRMQGVRLNASNPTVYAYGILEFAVLGQPANSCAKPANLATANIRQATANIRWDAVNGASSYLLRYKTPAVSSWVTRTTTNPTQSLSALACGTDYAVEVQAICGATNQSSFSSLSFKTGNCFNPCSLPTRYNNADIGDIGIAGSSCLNASIITVKGSGNHIGSTNDQFQFAFTNLAGDEDFTVHLTTQDLAGSQAGVMMRDSVSDTSPFAYIAIKAGSGAQFIYRSLSGGNVTIVQGNAALKAPIYLRLSKSGTVYTAYTSPSGVGNWTLIGSANLGFGGNTVYPGLAVASTNNNSLATATFDSFVETAPLPISLLSFTATNINNEYISVKWTTSMEENNDRFEIERSTDGMHFDWLTTVKSAGNSSTDQSYATADNHPAKGINFYRIKQYDRDGRVSLFPVAMVKFGTGAAPVVYPNPASDMIHIVSGAETIQSLALYDLLGKQIRFEKNPGGETDFKLIISNLSSGVYILKITTPSKIYQQKIMKD